MIAPPPLFHVHPEVSAALRRKAPVVALESTIIAHGMPYPQNLRTAQSLENTIRAHNATPATIAVLYGLPHIGLTPSQLHHLASPHTKVRKLARRDLPHAYATRATGATTVSATMAISAAAGISVFATGGIGGVHRCVVDSWDVSADITALAHIPQIVVCAGAKSILDLPKTLEALETASVPVLVLRSDTFPAFYTRGVLPAPARVQSPREAARVFYHARLMGTKNGVLLAVPIPVEFEADAGMVEKATQKTLEEMGELKTALRPQEVTPFLLKRVAEITNGESLRANVELAKNNAAVAAKVAVQLCALEKDEGGLSKTLEDKRSEVAVENAQLLPEVLVVGGVALDIHCDVNRDGALQMRASNRGIIRQCLGGVGRNVAEAASKLGGVRVSFVSAVGDDVIGEAVVRMLGESMDTMGVRKFRERRTATCCIVHDEKGDMAVGIGDMDHVFNCASVSLVSESRDLIESALNSVKMVCVDGNLSARDIGLVCGMCTQHGIACWFEPTTPQKSRRILQAGMLHAVDYISPNVEELRALTGGLNATTEDVWIARMAEDLLREGGGGKRGQRVLVTCGANGVERYSLKRGESGWILVETQFAARRVDVDGNTTGAGDWFAGRCIAALARGVAEDEAIELGMRAAEECCRKRSDSYKERGIAKL